jgi:hypothetical protein
MTENELAGVSDRLNRILRPMVMRDKQHEHHAEETRRENHQPDETKKREQSVEAGYALSSIRDFHYHFSLTISTVPIPIALGLWRPLEMLHGTKKTPPRRDNNTPHD